MVVFSFCFSCLGKGGSSLAIFTVYSSCLIFEEISMGFVSDSRKVLSVSLSGSKGFISMVLL